MTNVHFLGNIRRRKVYDDSESLWNRRRANSVHKNIVNNIGGKGRTQKYVYETRTSNFHLRKKNAYLGLSISLGVCYLIDVCSRNTEYVYEFTQQMVLTLCGDRKWPSSELQVILPFRSVGCISHVQQFFLLFCEEVHLLLLT